MLEVDLVDADEQASAAIGEGQLQPVDQATLKIGQVAGETFDLGILHRLYDNSIAKPVNIDNKLRVMEEQLRSGSTAE